MVQGINILDIKFTEQFIEDWNNTPKSVQKIFDNKLKILWNLGRFPNSMAPHKIYQDGLWIAHITQGGVAWRLLYRKNSGIVECDRIMTHHEMDKYLRRLEQ